MHKGGIDLIYEIFELKDDVELFTISYDGKSIGYSSFKVIETSFHEVMGENIYTKILSFENFKVRLVILEVNKKYKLYIQISADWPKGIQGEVKIKLTFLEHVFSNREGERSFHFPYGSKIIQPHRYFIMPLCIIDNKSQDVISIRFENHFNEDFIAWDQNRAIDIIFKIKSFEELKNSEIIIRPSDVFADIFVLDVSKISGGFNGFFKHYKNEERSKLDLSLYNKPELKWYRESVVNHFTYMFGKEAFDYERNEFALEKLLKEGKEFGGYDSLILWHQYPRLGIDQRSQWEFFDDFPGGRKGIKEIVENANSYDVKVFLPFKPWDIDKNVTEEELIDEFVKLLKDTGVNGMFFDTMTSIPLGFRKAADDVDKSFAFCTEGKPRTVKNLELITGSWDQFWNKDCVLEINIARYILPEHASPMISRWHLGESRTKFIKRAIWNGSGIVIWQDVFGAWCPYSDEHKALIKKWKNILKSNAHIYFGKEAIPLFETLQPNIYCNYFSDGSEEIYSLYNHGETKVTGSLVNTMNENLNSVVELWYGKNVYKKDLVLYGEILPKEILIVKCKEL